MPTRKCGVSMIHIHNEETDVNVSCTDTFAVRVTNEKQMLKISIEDTYGYTFRIATVYNFGDGEVGVELNHDMEGRLVL
jgi:hypothetical protein